MFPYSISSTVAGIPNSVERGISQIHEYADRIVAFISHNPNEFVIACSAFATAIFTLVLALRTAGLFKETAGLREETAALAKFAKQQAEDMKASIAAAQQSADAAIKALGANRAWFLFERVNTYDAVDGTFDGISFNKAFAVQVAWKNSGHSPALNAIFYKGHALIPFLSNEVPRFSPTWTSEQLAAGSAPIAPDGGQAQSPYAVIVDADRDAVVAREKAIVINCAAQYRDVFAPTEIRFSEVCAIMRHDGEIKDRNTGHRGIKWDITIAGPQNTAT